MRLFITLYYLNAVLVLTMIPSFVVAAKPNSYVAISVEKYEAKNSEITAFIKDHFAEKEISVDGVFYVARVADRIEAIICAVVRKEYPLTQTYELYIPHKAWKNKIGTSLLKRAMQQHVEKIHRVLLAADEVIMMRNLVQVGFKEMRSTWISEIEVESAIEALSKQHQLPPFPVRVMTQSNKELLEDWVQAHVRHYQASHSINPMRPQSDNGWRNLFAGKDFVPEDSFYATDKGGVISHASLRKDGDQFWFGWLGTSPRLTAAQAKAMNLSMALEVVKTARRKGARLVMIEADSTDPQVKEVMDFLPHRVTQELKTFQTGTPK